MRIVLLLIIVLLSYYNYGKSWETVYMSVLSYVLVTGYIWIENKLSKKD